jgi:hypothetical protein
MGYTFSILVEISILINKDAAIFKIDKYCNAELQN